MFARSGGSGAWRKAASAAVKASIRRESSLLVAAAKSTPTTPLTSVMHVCQRRHASSTADDGNGDNNNNSKKVRNPHPPSAQAKQKRDSDREFLLSILETSATKRDAKAYLQEFGSSSWKKASGTTTATAKTPAFTTVLSDGLPGVAKDVPQFVQGPVKEVPATKKDVPRVAIVKLREPQTWEDSLLDGVAKTLTQLRALGLRSVIVVDCDESAAKSQGLIWRDVVAQQVDRLQKAIGKYGSPGAELVDSAIWRQNKGRLQSGSSATSSDLFVGFGEAFTAPLKHGHLLVVPPRAFSEDRLESTVADANDVILALTAFFSGLQVDRQGEAITGQQSAEHKALVHRIIVIDPYGGIPASSTNDGARVFINLEEQFDKIRNDLASSEQETSRIAGNGRGIIGTPKARHAENLNLAKSALAILPSSSSVVITSPAEAANLRAPQIHQQQHPTQLAGEVKTRRWQNPLIHNLLTDRPIYSASLPIGRIKSSEHSSQFQSFLPKMPTTTLAKRGLPVTIFPSNTPWAPPEPGSPRLRLTDTCIDLPRLIHLINDSFSRKLDAEHYLARLENSLAGIIIAGEYEGGAILTWERPSNLTEEEAYSQGRLVPYLDKFAVLKRAQGAGGVADIVFNAMVRDAFPRGVCWRSRKDNPVNKWYFERSRGVRKLPESNWAMFWTTEPEAAVDEQVMGDYESVCRGVVPSWG
ncbi:putative mitochondrial precursor of N-acetylglutamate synthase [Cladorrhinum sp. PSN259]|nr:putative mitochondrial precursor of N-acetylglutamate synthase [Cladorrhinum sp. PSN259]